MTSLLPTPEPADPVEGALGHFEHSNWVKQALKNLDAGTARADGGVINGHVYINPASSEDAFLYLQGGGNRGVWGRTSVGQARWRMDLGTQDAEGGNNSGSKFGLVAYDDFGAVRHQVLSADRNTGLALVVGSPTSSKGIATKEYVDSTVIPVGAIIAFGGSVLPVGMQATWQICDGTPHNSAALQAVIGSANTPDLRSRFIIGAGQGVGLTSYPVGGLGGSEGVTLTEAQTPLKLHVHPIDHSHPAGTSGPGGSHTHTMNHDHAQINTGSDAHNHTISLREGTGTGDGYYVDTNPTDSGIQKTLAGTVTATDTHTHTVNLPTFSGSTGAEAAHTHSTSVGALVDGFSGSASSPLANPHENRPPYYALTYIIKKV